MMLTAAIPTNPGPSVYAHNHSPSVATSSSPSHPASPDSLPGPQACQSSTHVRRGMENKASTGSAMTPDHTNSNNERGHPPPPAAQLIPMTALHQPFILGPGGASYALLPSIQQVNNLSGGNDATMFGIQPLGAISTLPRPTATGTAAAAPTTATLQPIETSYYSRVQPDPSPMVFQQPLQQRTATSSDSRHLNSTSIQVPPPPTTASLHPHSFLISGTGSGLILNRNQTASTLGPKPSSTTVPTPNLDSRVVLPEKASSPPSSSSPQTYTGHGSRSTRVILDKSTSSSDPEIHRRNSIGDVNNDDIISRRRQSHDMVSSHSFSQPQRHVSQSDSNTASSEIGLPKDIRVKHEPLGDDPPLHSVTTRRNSDSNLDEAAGLSSSSSSSKSYQISALIDVPPPPMNQQLNKASRTSSLSSSLSSFRFGGSLSQLWASQISLSGKINNMKSTGNLNADAAVMPSLGNQYFAFGGSLPELSLTSLSRLLPNSSANDSGMSSCPGLFTLPLYVYPSQQHLATPFINTHGSITFGSFLSNGSSLCSTSRGSAGGGGSSNNMGTPGEGNTGDADCDVTNNDNNTEEILDGCGQTGSPSPLRVNGCGQTGSSSSLQENIIKLPMYSPISGAILGGAAPGVITSLPAFSTLARGMEADPSSTKTAAASNTNSSSSPSSNHPNSLGSHCIATITGNTIRHHPQGIASSNDHAHHPHHLPLHNPAQPHLHGTTPEGASDKHPHLAAMSPGQPDLYMAQENTILQTVPTITSLNRIKLESDMEPLELDPTHRGLALVSPEGARLNSPHGQIDMGRVIGTKDIKKEKDKPYKCDHPGCGRSFSFPAHLRSHIQQIHISYRPCKCEFPGCGKRFYTPQHLNVHRRVHTGERPFVCPYTECTKAFTTAGNLKNHIRTHTGERPYACKFEGCGKRFAEMSSLKKHELTHTGEKPYKCRVCGKAFSQAGSRNTHERKHNRTEDEEGEGVSIGVGGVMGGAKGSKKYRIKRISGSGTIEEAMEQ